MQKVTGSSPVSPTIFKTGESVGLFFFRSAYPTLQKPTAGILSAEKGSQEKPFLLKCTEITDHVVSIVHECTERLSVCSGLTSRKF